VLGAVGLLNCCAVEKHFTFDNTLGESFFQPMLAATVSRAASRRARARRPSA
jgi:hypothetical protein